MPPTADDWIQALNLLPHPEGGFYREVYRSLESVAGEHLPARYGSSRNLGTSIYYLLRHGDHSRFHRLKSDEIWHYHAGGGATLHLLLEGGQYQQQRIGSNPGAGELPQIIIPHGARFGADFQLADRTTLLRLYPAHGNIISELSGGSDGGT